jgi:4-diphosphocytidyl-2-C-methyl-D-erythritol kinase
VSRADRAAAGDTRVSPNTVEVLAFAKLNLCLRVVGRRDDGFHDLETVVVPISLADRLRVHAFADATAFRTLSLALDVAGDRALTRGVPVDETNLVLRAATAMAEAEGVRGFAEFVLTKHVPPAAGLGGGSADAAATLRALNDLWGLGLGGGALSDIGATVGSDVPALLAGGPVMARGRGERVERMPGAVPMDWAIVTFAVGVSTAEAFAWWDEDGGPSGPDPGPLLAALAGGDEDRIGGLLFNDLDGPVSRRRPDVAQAKRLLIDGGAVGAVLCGSGPSVAGLLARAGGLEPGVKSELERVSGRPPAFASSAPA